MQEEIAEPIEVKKKKSFWKIYGKLLLIVFAWFACLSIIGLFLGDDIGSATWCVILKLVLPIIACLVGFVVSLVYTRAK